MKKYLSEILYAFEGLIIGFFGHKILNDVIIPVLVAAVCAVVTVTVQHYWKQFLNSRRYKKGFFKQNGEDK